MHCASCGTELTQLNSNRYAAIRCAACEVLQCGQSNVLSTPQRPANKQQELDRHEIEADRLRARTGKVPLGVAVRRLMKAYRALQPAGPSSADSCARWIMFEDLCFERHRLADCSLDRRVLLFESWMAERGDAQRPRRPTPNQTSSATRSSAQERVRAAALAEAAALERSWDLARLPARRGEEPIDPAIDRLMPTFIEVAMADAVGFAMKGGGSLPVGSAAGALGARSRAELRLYVADWILRADLADPQLREQDSPLAGRVRVFEDVCRHGFAEMGIATGANRNIKGRQGLILLACLVLVLFGIYAHYNL